MTKNPRRKNPNKKHCHPSKLPHCFLTPLDLKKMVRLSSSHMYPDVRNPVPDKKTSALGSRKLSLKEIENKPEPKNTEENPNLDLKK